jgi:hypothetical protein
VSDETERSEEPKSTLVISDVFPGMDDIEGRKEAIDAFIVALGYDPEASPWPDELA